jgi:sugar phosphate isomerase/epimerase
MKLAISNIAWEQHNNIAVLNALKNHGVSGIEVAPTKIWPDWSGASRQHADQYRCWLADEGFEIPAMQAILFAMPDIQILDVQCQQRFLEHMERVADIAAGFNAKVLVLGAPKNRRRGQLSMSESREIAVEVLRKAGEICADRGCCIGLEHNPIEYGCDFVTNVADAREIVDSVDHKGVQLHLDAAGIHMCGGQISEVITGAGAFVHFHISEPMLEPIANGIVDHESAISTLKELDYDGWVSIEMKQPQTFQLVLDSLKALEGVL